LKRRFPNEPEYHQAVEEVLSTIEEEYNKHPELGESGSVVHLQTEGIGVDFSVEGGIIVDDGICQYTFGQGTVQNVSFGIRGFILDARSAKNHSGCRTG
jgi:hypothetical protein